MARQHSYEDLDEMLVPGQSKGGDLDDIHVPKKSKEPKKGQSGKTPRQLEREAKKRQEVLRIVMIVSAIFLLLVAVLIGVGIAMGQRAGVDDTTVDKALPDETRTMFLNEQNIPELSAEGVKGLLKEAYFTVDGDLAVTLKLSNGTNKEHEVVRIACTIFNDKNETVARQTVDEFDPAVKVPANGYSEAYFIIDEQNVAMPNDPLSQLGTTLEIGSSPTDGSGKEDAADANGPKAIAEGRTYYENTGNIPELSAEGVKGTVIRARYTNDGSLAVTLSLSNGMDADHQVTQADITIQNGAGETIASQSFTAFDTPCIVRKQSYGELELIIDTANVPLKDDPLSTLSCTVSIGTGPVAAATEASADAAQ